MPTEYVDLNLATVKDLLSIEAMRPGFVEELIALFQYQSSKDLKKLQTFPKNQDLNFRDIAHRLKGSSLSLGLAQLAAAFQRLEKLEQIPTEQAWLEGFNEIQTIYESSLKNLREHVNRASP